MTDAILTDDPEEVDSLLHYETVPGTSELDAALAQAANNPTLSKLDVINITRRLRDVSLDYRSAASSSSNFPPEGNARIRAIPAQRVSRHAG